MSHQTECSNNFLNKTLKRFYSEGKTRFYLSEFVDEAKVSVREAEDFFIPLMGVGKIEGKLEVRCPNCGKDLGVFDKLPEIPEKIVCEYCGQQFSKALEYIEIVLEVQKGFFRAQKESCSNPSRENTHKRRTGTVIEQRFDRT